LSALTAGLASVLKTNGAGDGPAAVLAREPSPYASSYASEIVTCRCGADELRLYCKYSAGGHGHTGYGLWGGVGYEAEVYRHVLSPAGAVTPRFYGSHTDAATGETWLVLQYLVDSEPIHRYPESLPQAARWLGLFHAVQEARLAQSIEPCLHVYDAAFYTGWARRTALFAQSLQARFPWLGVLCERFEEATALLLAPPPSVIHGEFYPGNILLHRGRVYPIDWESAAVAAGEIDLASLTERWPAAVARCCEAEYRRARWPGGAPADWGQRLAVARLYLAFRWLGERPDWTTDDSDAWRFELLRSAGKRLGLL
jgi:hypothetical protein